MRPRDRTTACRAQPCTKDCKVCVDCSRSRSLAGYPTPLARRARAARRGRVLGRARDKRAHAVRPHAVQALADLRVGAGRRRRLRASTAARPALAARAPLASARCSSTPIRRRIGSGSTGSARVKALTSATVSPAEAAAAIERVRRPPRARPQLASSSASVSSSPQRGMARADDYVVVRGAYYREASTRVIQPMVELQRESPTRDRRRRALPRSTRSRRRRSPPAPASTTCSPRSATRPACACASAGSAAT